LLCHAGPGHQTPPLARTPSPCTLTPLTLPQLYNQSSYTDIWAHACTGIYKSTPPHTPPHTHAQADTPTCPPCTPTRPPCTPCPHLEVLRLGPERVIPLEARSTVVVGHRGDGPVLVHILHTIRHLKNGPATESMRRAVRRIRMHLTTMRRGRCRCSVDVQLLPSPAPGDADPLSPRATRSTPGSCARLQCSSTLQCFARPESRPWRRGLWPYLDGWAPEVLGLQRAGVGRGHRSAGGALGHLSLRAHRSAGGRGEGRSVAGVGQGLCAARARG
jgi:hypothetical protein